MILVVDLNWKRNSLANSEFVAPIVSAIEPLEACVVKHFLDVGTSELENYSHIVLSGTTLKDFEAQNHLNCFGWIKSTIKPVLGICAGMQIIGLLYGTPLRHCLGIGMTEIKTSQSNPLFSGCFQAYTLHSLTVSRSKTFEVLAESEKCIQAIKLCEKPIYGVLFHPEVRNQEILKKFIAI
jgi:GMP synthase-like glutamine amidotransferase